MILKSLDFAQVVDSWTPFPTAKKLGNILLTVSLLTMRWRVLRGNANQILDNFDQPLPATLHILIKSFLKGCV
jgi:hypothetical protein